ncbi:MULTISPECIES: LPD29 domain-containing protein [Hymenobacter]|uniref:Large polyvalent protein associated domain-containing protein n=1 Tax=Hymenobacter mucosus TaxID=1411120 RepID=A0A239BER6_9BACT|nr:MULTISPECIES: LPD29 domain-containing protein [Hymenobacter]MDF7815478.1 hypothetical protein [Hymenobacter sp. YC55]SNS05543.1 hypothetical protein SAMN06269173_12125 [Hymenobacter mucosus]
MPSTATPQQISRESFIKNGRKITVEGVSDAVGVGYVQEFMPGKISYLVFLGKQSHPHKYFAATSAEEAEKQIIKHLTAAGEAAQRKAEARKEARQPFTERKQDGITTRSYTTAGTAQLIREALKKAFPGVKFSVTSEVYANGSSVDIRYTDGPSAAQVKEVYAPFISGTYNSLEDMYEYKEDTTSVAPSGELLRLSYGAKYIQSHRRYSAAYGFFLNSLDLREQPPLAAQFAAFHKWHSSQRYDMQTSYGEKNGTHTVSSNSSHGDLEQFAAALVEQGHIVSLSTTGDELSARSSTPALSEVEPLAEPDQTDREYYAAEMQWLADPGQDSTDQEFEAAERS